MTLLREKETTCRKPFRCMAGNVMVEKGEKYMKATVAWDDRVYDWKQCLKCYQAQQESDRPEYLYEEECFNEGWAYEDKVGCCADK